MTSTNGPLARLKRRLSAALGGPDPDPVTVVSGLPRSGTSMTMQMLEAGGIEPLTDGRREADEDNPRGYYELERVKRLPEGDDEWLREARGRAVKIVSALLPHLPEGHRYEVVLMQRRLDEVLASQRRMLQRRGGGSQDLDEDELAARFREHLEEARAWARRREDVRMLAVDYNAVVEEPQPRLERLAAFLSHDVDVDAMKGVVDPDLYRQREEELATSG